MKKYVFFGPTLLAGIGQVTHALSKLVYGDYIEYGKQVSDRYDVGVCFIIPVPTMIDMMKVYSTTCKRIVYITVCETETVHHLYERLFELDTTFYTPSDYASTILKRQFPRGNFPVLRHYAPPNVYNFKLPTKWTPPDGAYVFYHIGNVIDRRKNIKMLIEAFIRLSLPNSFLVLKATCNKPFTLSIPNVIVFEGLMTHEELEGIHAIGDCYVSCSHSEGAGMGAIEAAMRNKPVIVPEYGASIEYIDTPYVIKCGRTKIGVDDFLYTADMEWGDPEMESLKTCMRDVYEKRLRTQNHPKTHTIMSLVPIALNEVLAGDEGCQGDK